MAQETETGLMHGWDISFETENSKVMSQFAIPNKPGIPGTSLSFNGLGDVWFNTGLIAYYQRVGDDITEVSRALDGTWSERQIEIPHE